MAGCFGELVLHLDWRLWSGHRRSSRRYMALQAFLVALVLYLYTGSETPTTHCIKSKAPGLLARACAGPGDE